MECTWPESLPSSKKKAIEELVQGRDIANQLCSLLNKLARDNNNNKAALAEDLVLKILKSFTNMWWSVWGKTIISDWGLECASSFVIGLPASSIFIGSLIGGFTLAMPGDIFLGRKNLLYISCLIMSIASLLTAFSMNIWMHSTLRLVSGIGRASIMTCSFILLTERVGKRWRGQIGSATFCSYTVGVLSLPALAYMNRGSSWRILYLYTSIPAIFYCIITYFFVYESHRWLFMQGRDKEALTILGRTASIEVKSLDSYLSSITLNREISKVNPYKLMEDLFKRSWALQRVLATMVLGFGIGVAFFGMLFGVENLG
ncbi:hypothetical protein SO802_011014 [Lithocarpus litseifolius]|uniref:Major facilitator superfamily (MFS) profile domain-containing protein n=1 Tax=Lithocarpus litseifolius TaxID=425828 RepID=A0AAW2DI28_9ROSI